VCECDVVFVSKERSVWSGDAVYGFVWTVGCRVCVILVMVGLSSYMCEISYERGVGGFCGSSGGVGVSIWGVGVIVACM